MTDLGTAEGKIVLDGSQATAEVAKVNTAVGTLDKSSKSSSEGLNKLSTGMVAVGAVGVAAFGLAVNAAASFEKQLSNFGAVADGTEAQMEAIRQKALDLGADTAFSANEAAMAMTELAKAGVPVEGILNGAADATVALAAAGEIELANAAAISAAALNQFKLQAEDLPAVADLLAGAANASATGVAEVGQALSFVGPVAQSTGLSIEDTAGAIALLANNGIDASKAGTTMRAILTGLQPVSKRNKEAMKELGLWTEKTGSAFFDSSGKVKPMNEIVGLLNSSMAGLTHEQRLAYAEAIFGQEALAGISAMAGTTQEEFLGLQATIGDVSATEVAAEKMNNLAGDVEELSGAFETFMIQTGTPFLSVIRSIVRGITELINIVGGLSPRMQQVAAAVFFGTTAFIGFMGIMIKMQKMVQSFRLAMVALNATFLTNPVVLVIAGLVALGAAFVIAYQRSETFRNIVQSAFRAVSSAIQPVIDWVTNFATQISHLWATFRAGLLNLDYFAAKMDLAVGGGGRLRDIILTVANFLTGTLWPAIQRIGAILQQVFQAVVAAVVPYVLEKFWQIVHFFQEIMPQVIEAARHIWNNVWALISAYLDLIVAVVTAAVALVIALWQAWGDDLIGLASTIWNSIRSVIDGALNIIMGVIKTVLAIINGDWGKAWNGIKQILSGVWGVITGIVQGAAGTLRAIIAGLVSTLQAVWSGGWRSMLSAAQSIIGSMLGVIGAIPGRILGALGNLGGLLAGAGRDLINGLIRGITGAAGALYDKVSGIASNIKSKFSSVLKIFSPSRVFEDYGRDIIQGLNNGLESLAPKSIDFMENFAPTLMPELAYPSLAVPVSGNDGGTAGNNLTFNFEFSGVSAADIPAIKSAVTGPDVINSLIRAAKAGTR